MLSRGVSLTVLSWTLVVVSSTIVAFRFLARCIRLGRLEIDDYLMFLALLTQLVYTSILTVAQHYGLGAHIWNLARYNRINAEKYTWILEGLSVASSMFGRISFAVFLIMVLGQTAWKKRCILWSIVAEQAIINVITIVQIYAQCGSHLGALWDPKVSRVAHCQSMDVQTNIAYVQSGLNSLSDLLLTVLPSLIVWELNLPRRAKIGLCAALGLSLFALIASLVKIPQLRNLSLRDDLTYEMVSLQFCVGVENNVVIIAASIPKLRPLYHRHTPLYVDRSHETQLGMGGAPNARQKTLHLPEQGSSQHEAEYIENNINAQDAEVNGMARTVDVEIGRLNGSASLSSPNNTQRTANAQPGGMLRFWRHSEISITI